MLACVLLAGCQGPGARPAATVPAPAREPVPDDASTSIYSVVPDDSEVRVLVYRGGPMARLGHNHVMVAPVHGDVRAGPGAGSSSFFLEIEVESLQVDPPAVRAEEGEAFASKVTARDRDGTRANMLGERMLDAARCPRILIDSVALAGPRWNPDVQANVTLRGTTTTVAFPATVVEHGDTLTIVARLSLDLADFGIEPFSVLGGALQVQHRVDVRVRLVAVRRPAGN